MGLTDKTVGPYGDKRFSYVLLLPSSAGITLMLQQYFDLWRLKEAPQRVIVGKTRAERISTIQAKRLLVHRFACLSAGAGNADEDDPTRLNASTERPQQLSAASKFSFWPNWVEGRKIGKAGKIKLRYHNIQDGAGWRLLTDEK